ncbi:MAG TPA: hypothetical protein ENL20_02365 [Candidatus Cloacimonetes bacterium]|nr:hypothetical protein [Candidatus Cloacimonadota bacterium]
MAKDNDVLFILTNEDAQIVSRDLIGRDLSSTEMQYVKKGLEYGLDDWAEVMRISIKNAVEFVNP